MRKDASPAVRHALWVATLSVLAGGAGAWVGWQVFGGLGTLFGFLVCLVASKLLLLAVFLDRFLSRLLRSSVRLRPSRNEVSDTARGHVEQLHELGFVSGETLVMVDEDDRALGGPYAMLSHSSQPMAAWVGPVNITISSELPERRLLLTTNQPHVPTESLAAQVFPGEGAKMLVQHHEKALSRLVAGGADARPRRIDPQYALIADEECERAYFRGMSRLERVRGLLRLTRDATPSDVGA